MIKRVLWVLAMAFAVAICAKSQLKTGDWNVYSAYGNEITAVVESTNYVYFVSDKGLFRFGKATSLVENLNKRSGVNDYVVANIYYDYCFDNVVVVYENSNIDIIASDGSVSNVSGIADVQLAGTRTVNDVTFAGKLMYVATDFGYLVYDIQASVAVELNMFYSKVNSVAQIGERVVMGTDAGLLISPVSANHATLDCFTNVADWNVGKLLPVADDAAFLARNDAVVYLKFSADNTVNGTKIFTATNARVVPSATGVVASATGSQSVAVSDFSGNTVTYTVPAGYLYGNINADGTMWRLGTDGLCKVKTDGRSLTAQGDAVKPNTCTMKRAGHLVYNEALDCLYMTTLGRSNLENDYGMKGHINTFKNGSFTDLTPQSVPNINSSSAKGMLQDLYTPVFDPNDPETYYVGTWYEGAYRLKGNEVTGKFDWTNSPLALKWFCYVNGLAFDRDNNLWMQGLTANGPQISVLTADKLYKENLTADDWIRLPVTLPSSASFRSFLTITRNGNIKIAHTGSWDPIVTFIDDGGNPASTDMKYVRFTSFVDQYGTKYAPHWHYAMFEDSKGMVWLATSEGAANFDPTKVFDDDFHVNRFTVDDGTYLLDGLDVTSISEDAQGHIWLATITSGLYEVSADGCHILNHFTADNSLLPDDFVYSVCCKPQGGAVYVGTGNGFAVFNPGVTPGERDYSHVTISPANVPSGYTGLVAVEKLVAGSTVNFVDAKGTTVATVVADGGTALWDLNDTAGKRVPTGRYTITAKPAEGSADAVVVGRINVVR